MNHRRQFLKKSLGGAAGLIALPNLFSGSLFAATSANKLLQVALIGCGRMGLTDLGECLAVPQARLVGVCDVDTRRSAEAQRHIEEFYKAKGESNVAVKIYEDFTEILADPEIDAVIISTPDHCHGYMAVKAALAGKHIYCQKPLTYDISESIALQKAVQAKKIILQVGSQQRSVNPFKAFRPASEFAVNGRVGNLKTIKIGIGLDHPSGKKPAAMPIPENFDFDRWLGPAPQQDYMELRCHPQDSFGGRPGWITTEDFGLGMITNWGAHHIDIAHWGMGQQLGGPSVIEAKATFMTDDVWTVHHKYHIEMLYPDGVQVILDDTFENGIHFEGDEGWVFCSRSSIKVTASDGDKAGASELPALRASKDSILSKLGADAILWPSSENHKQNWVEAVIANTQPVAPLDQGVRTMQACAAAWIGMKLGRKVNWDVATASFGNDGEANALCRREPRSPQYDCYEILKKSGV